MSISYMEFKNIKTLHVKSLFRESERFISYKNISIWGAVSEITLQGDWLQFGVFKGQTARILESFILGPQKLHLFDSFEGLPENWQNTIFEKSAFKLNADEIPNFDPKRSVIHQGWFEETIPKFTKEHSGPIPSIHLDADLYSSTRSALDGLNKFIAPGTILLFDKFFLPTEQGIADDECRALFDWASDFDRRFQFLWRTEWVQLAVKVLK